MSTEPNAQREPRATPSWVERSSLNEPSTELGTLASHPRAQGRRAVEVGTSKNSTSRSWKPGGNQPRRLTANNGRILSPTSAFALVAAGETGAAHRVVEPALVTGVELESSALVASALVQVTAIVLDQAPDVAARLLGALEALTERSGDPIDTNYDQPLLDRVRKGSKERLGDGFEREWEAGKALTLDEVVALAVGDDP